MSGRAPAKLLVVDDNATKRFALKSVLLPLGYTVVEADSGLSALRCVRDEDFAVILLDVRMPGMDGFETAALIRTRRQSETTPIIFITAAAPDEIDAVERYSEGAVDFIFAPVQPDELRAKVAVFVKLFLRADKLAVRAAEVRRSADQLRQLTDAAPIGIFQTDAQGRYTYTNPRWSQITGIHPAAATGRTWHGFLDDEQRAGLRATGGDTLPLADSSRRFELLADGRPPAVTLVTSAPIQDGDGHLTGWVGTLADVTAEAGAEAALSAARDDATTASQLKSDFLANMSHEIRTPMNGVIGMTDLLLETDLDVRQRDYAQTVRNSGEALLTIINDILDFSRVEAGKLELSTGELDVRLLVDGVVDLLAGPAQVKGLELLAVVDRQVPRVVVGDAGRIRQVLMNLIGNAVKFTTAGSVVVRVTVPPPGEPGGPGGPGEEDPAAAGEPAPGATVLRFEVSDTGSGIPQDKLTTIFEPFTQADTSTSRRYGGTGLGLAISSNLVALMGGRCGAASRPGAGSTFWFTISVTSASTADTPPGGPRSSARPGPDADLSGVVALVVDDNAAQLDALTGHLEGWGMSVTTAPSAEAALVALRSAAAQGRPVAVALVDRSMPGTDGIRLSESIAADSRLTAEVVLMTDLGDLLDDDDGRRHGVRASLTKPIHLAELRSCLRMATGAEVEPATPAHVAARRSTDAPVLGRLLLAEDNAINQKVAVAMLSGAGYRVDTVLDGRAAVQAAAAHHYDAILMDCQMPEMNGYEATAAIRAREGPDRHTPIIAMTAGARRQDRDRCLAEGMDAYVSKPVSKEALLALIARWLPRGERAAVPLRAGRRSTDPVIDSAVFDELRAADDPGQSTFLVEIVEQFVTDATAGLALLRAALASNDVDAVGRLAHSLKGSSGQLGGVRLASSCSRLETAAADGRLDEAGGDLDDVELEFEEMRRLLLALAPPG